MIQTNWRNIQIEACLTPEEDTIYGEGIYHHDITISNTDTKVTFPYWGSEVNPEVNTHIDACYALQWFVDKAIDGLDTYEDYLTKHKKDNDELSVKQYKFCKSCHKSLSFFLENSEVNLDILSLGVLLHKSEQTGYM